MNTPLCIDGTGLALTDLRAAQAGPLSATLGSAGRAAMLRAQQSVQRALDDDRVCYGVNTGFGAFANRRIDAADLEQLQYNLVRSHSCGIGDPLKPRHVRRILLLKANSLAAGFSGVRPVVVETLLALLNADVLPVIPGQGSVGASGDLAPLAHLSLALIGEGEALKDGVLLTGHEVLEAAGTTAVALAPKEGLALLNGTQVSAALAIDGLLRATTLMHTSVVAGALSVDGLAGSYTPFDARIHSARRLPGQIEVARQFRSLLTDGEMVRSHADCDRVQDPYALRCMPQVIGAVCDTLRHAAHTLTLELNSVTDNPLIFGDDILSGGNFHAAPLGFISDFMAIAAAELGSMSERRTDLFERRINTNLNMFLTAQPGLESGFMIAHVSAAALASENKTLAHPASVDSIPTSAGQEDHVSMATWAGLKLQRLCDNVEYILAIELLAAAHAIDRQAPLSPTPELKRVHAAVRALCRYDASDHRHDREIATLAAAIRTGDLAALLPAQAEFWPWAQVDQVSGQ